MRANYCEVIKDFFYYLFIYLFIYNLIGLYAYSSLTAVFCFDNDYVGKQPVAWNEYCAGYWIKELQESIDRCTGRRDIIEILLKTAFNTIHSTIFIHIQTIKFTTPLLAKGEKCKRYFLLFNQYLRRAFCFFQDSKNK